MREVVERHGGHRRHGRRAPRDLQDRGAELDALGLGGEPGQRRGGVGPVRLGRPHRVEAGRLGLEQQVALIVGGQAEAPVAQHQPQPHASLLSPLVRARQRGASYVLAECPHETPTPSPRPAPRHRLPAAAHARGDARRHRQRAHHRGRLHRSPGRRLPDARRAPQRRPHQPRDASLRRGTATRARAPPASGDRARAHHAARDARGEHPPRASLPALADVPRPRRSAAPGWLLAAPRGVPAPGRLPAGPGWPPAA